VPERAQYIADEKHIIESDKTVTGLTKKGERTLKLLKPGTE
jgi:hypothetical protein